MNDRHLESVTRQRDEHFAEILRAREILTGLTLYRERLVCFIPNTTAAQRDRIRELATQDCDYDRSVLELLDDFDRLSALAAADAPAQSPAQTQRIAGANALTDQAENGNDE